MKATVLVTAAGSIVAQGIMKSLKLANKTGNISYTLVSADMNRMAAGLYRSDCGIIVPSPTHPEYVDVIVDTCKRFGALAVFCGSDDELMALSDARSSIKKRCGAKVIVGTKSALEIGRDKWRTFQFCEEKNEFCAPSCLPERADEFVAEYGFPAVVKPREGYGSLQVYVVRDIDELRRAIQSIRRSGWRPMVQKYIPGDEEFTSGVTLDREARYAMSSIAIRKILKNGQTNKAFINDYVDVRKSAEQLAMKLASPGPVNIQTKLDPDTQHPILIEINPRFSATCPMRAVAGVNEPDIVFRNVVLGEETKIDSYSRLFCTRYLNEIYVPLEEYEKFENCAQSTIENPGSFIPEYF